MSSCVVGADVGRVALTAPSAAARDEGATRPLVVPTEAPHGVQVSRGAAVATLLQKAG